ncbi:retrotransposon protein, putative, Ty1-copia subclass [Senna tora]|uniref:Retrotransposon protein, putative, Ty1-copia subclass n=1 Tax=Senna tora TaxID=362788 RepID=A0A834WQC5_9FABA|nr:retrotransposon protein, putative, Ty1-copia subclass [Senna tora]
MAATTPQISRSVSSSSSAPTAASKTYSLFSSSSNQAQSVKLDRTNYLFWQSVVLPLVKGNFLESYIDGTGVVPAKMIDYKSLQPFGCACYPCLKPYNEHKLQFHSQRCIYLGPAPQQKGHKCMNSNGRIYISRHVIFNPLFFPGSCGFLNRRSGNNKEEEECIIPFSMSDINARKDENVDLTLQNTSSHTSSSSSSLSKSRGSAGASHSNVAPLNAQCPTATCPTGTFPSHGYTCPTDISPSHGSASVSRGASSLHEFESGSHGLLSTSRDGPSDLSLCPPNSSSYSMERECEQVGHGNHATNSIIGPSNAEMNEAQQHNEGTHQRTMTTRSMVGIHKPKYPFIGNLYGESSLSPAAEPSSVTEALALPHWKQAMNEEFSALKKNNTWELEKENLCKTHQFIVKRSDLFNIWLPQDLTLRLQ